MRHYNNDIIRSQNWHDGHPPHVGWWLTRLAGTDMMGWRWWHGRQWSVPAMASWPVEQVAEHAALLCPPRLMGDIMWCTYWPPGARVPRVDPDGQFDEARRAE